MIPLRVVRLTISASPFLMRRTPPVTNAPTHASEAMPENGVGRTNTASPPSTSAAAKYQRVLMRTGGSGGGACSRASWAIRSIRLSLSAWSPTRRESGAAALSLLACLNTYGSLMWAHRVLRSNPLICDRGMEAGGAAAVGPCRCRVSSVSGSSGQPGRAVRAAPSPRRTRRPRPPRRPRDGTTAGARPFPPARTARRTARERPRAAAPGSALRSPARARARRAAGCRVPARPRPWSPQGPRAARAPSAAAARQATAPSRGRSPPAPATGARLAARAQRRPPARPPPRRRRRRCRAGRRTAAPAAAAARRARARASRRARTASRRRWRRRRRRRGAGRALRARSRSPPRAPPPPRRAAAALRRARRRRARAACRGSSTRRRTRRGTAAPIRRAGRRRARGSAARPMRAGRSARRTVRSASSASVRVMADTDRAAAALQHDQLRPIGLPQRLGAQHGGGPAVVDLAPVEAQNAIPLARLADVVRRHEQRAALGAELGEQRVDPCRADAVDAGERLVEQQHRPDQDALALAAGERAEARVRLVREADALEHRARGIAIAPGDAPEPRGARVGAHQHDVEGAHGEVEPRALRLGHVRGCAWQLDLAAPDRQLAQQRTEEGCLAAAVGAEDADDLAGLG